MPHIDQARLMRKSGKSLEEIAAVFGINVAADIADSENTIAKHGDHDQSTHGRRGGSGGSKVGNKGGTSSAKILSTEDRNGVTTHNIGDESGKAFGTIMESKNGFTAFHNEDPYGAVTFKPNEKEKAVDYLRAVNDKVKSVKGDIDDQKENAILEDMQNEVDKGTIHSNKSADAYLKEKYPKYTSRQRKYLIDRFG